VQTQQSHLSWTKQSKEKNAEAQELRIGWTVQDNCHQLTNVIDKTTLGIEDFVIAFIHSRKISPEKI
jgi:hypothetical protein